MAWIKIDKGIIDSYCFANANHFKIWIWLLLKANYKRSYANMNVGNGTTTVMVERGQLLFGRMKAEEELGLDGSMIYRAIKKFEELEQIKVESNSKYSIITICKYDSYQNNLQDDEQPMSSQRTTNEQPTNNKRTASEQQVNTSKEVLEVKEEIEYKEEKQGRLNEFEKKIKEDMVVVEMMKTWMKHNPNYFEEKENDYTACLQIAYKIAKYKKWKEVDVVGLREKDVLNSWDKICLFIRSDQFLKKLSVTNICNQFQLVVQKMNNPTENEIKPLNSPISSQTNPTIKPATDEMVDKYRKPIRNAVTNP